MLATNISLQDALRPKSLDEVIGHESLKPTIRKFIDQECTKWLFHGPTGTGKTSLAHIVARGIRRDSYPDDVIEINGAVLRSVGDMRDLVNEIQCYPMTGKYRVIILDEAQALTDDARSVLLKPLEENSTNVWVLCTMEVKKLNQALRDRCVSFPLRGMGSRERTLLVSRAAEFLGYTGDTSRFLRVINDKDLISARDVLGSFEKFANGMAAEDTVG